MPGKKQLQQFSKDVLKIGDEVKVRASRGEKPAIFAIPEDIYEDDDSQDFVFGMPEKDDRNSADISENKNRTENKSENKSADSAGDFDFGVPDNSRNEGAAVESVIPDLDSILNGGTAAKKPETDTDFSLPDSDFDLDNFDLDGFDFNEPGTSADPFATSGDDLGASAAPFATGGGEPGTNAEPFGTSGDELGTAADSFATGGDGLGASADPFGTSGDEPGASADPFGTSGDEPGTAADPFGTGGGELGVAADPFATSGDEPGTAADPFSTSGDELGTAADPFGTGSDEPGTAADPFGTSGDDLGTAADPFGTSGDELGTAADPFGTSGEEPGTSADPFGIGGGESGISADPFGTSGGESGTNADPFAIGGDNLGASADPFGTYGDELGTNAEPIDLNMDLPPELVEVPGTLDLGEENRQKPSGVGTAADPFAIGGDNLGASADPFATSGDELGTSANPFGTGGDEPGTAADPFGTSGDDLGTAADPFGTSGDELGTAADPFGTSGEEPGTSADPFGIGGGESGISADPFGTSGGESGTSADPFATGGGEPGTSADPFGTVGDDLGTAADPFGTSGDESGTNVEPIDLNMDLPPELVEVPGTLDLGEENRQKPSGVGTAADSFATGGDEPGASADPFATSGDELGTAADPFATGGDDLGTNADPFGTSGDESGTSADPFGTGSNESGTAADPFGTGGGESGISADPFGTGGDDLGASADPFSTSGNEPGTAADPFGTSGDELGTAADSFGTSGDEPGTNADLFGTGGDEPGASVDPFGTGGGEPGTSADPFGTGGDGLGTSADPFATGGDAGNSDEKIDTFNDIDVSDLENIDFSSGKTGDSGSADFSNIDIKDTDESFSHSDDDFDLGGDDEFYIPGFSDTLEADLDNAVQKTVNPVELGKAQTSPAEKNSITEDEYKKFKKNLSHYPLNVKIAIEEMIANDEFTKDTVFEVIEKVIKKVSARNLASHLEKILDISLPVPRDFEHRTVEEYEAYKASFEYQLKNRIIPVILLSLGLGFISLFLFLCGKHYIYRPLKANSLYKQGYALLEADEYPQAEQRFKEAVRYRNIKSWFYKFAQGYRNHKQYERAAVMYDDILKRYKNDKQAGLEYARMQWQDLSDYEGAIRILNDRLLLYFVNDADGLLELGDIYLDWGDNGNPEMYENARSNYASLMSLYGAKDLYLSRMLRYFIKTDDLKEVLRLKEIFYPKKKTLGALELTELSGYMFEKMTGKLSPSEAYLKDRIEDVKALMEKAIEADPTNPTALYNMARYYINMTNFNGAMAYLDAALDAFKNARTLKKADVYKQIDSYRLKGEIFIKKQEIIKAVETFTDGISTFKAQVPALPGNHIIGQLYSDMADIDYFKFNNIDSAFEYYKAAIENENDTPSIRYKIGAIQYEKGAMQEAMGSFMATAEAVPDDNNLLMALGNVLINRNSYNAAKGYFEKLIDNLNVIRSDKKIMIPQSDPRDEAIVDMYMKACNNLGVILYNLAKRTGNSQLRAQATINFTESMRAGDALTRNQTSMKRKDVSNLAEENIRYMIKPGADFEPAAYPDIPRTLSGEEKGLQVF